MKKQFYSHIVEVDSIEIALHDLDLSPEERQELTNIMESSIHHVVLDTILSELNSYDKKLFLHHLLSDKHDEVWELLNKKVENIEDKIKKAVTDLKEHLHEDIHEAKKKR